VRFEIVSVLVERRRSRRFRTRPHNPLPGAQPQNWHITYSAAEEPLTPLEAARIMTLPSSGGDVTHVERIVVIPEGNPHHTEQVRAEKARLLARGYLGRNSAHRGLERCVRSRRYN